MNLFNHYNKNDFYKYDFYKKYLKYISFLQTPIFLNYPNKYYYKYYTIYEKYLNNDLYFLEKSNKLKKHPPYISPTPPPMPPAPQPLPPSHLPPLIFSTKNYHPVNRINKNKNTPHTFDSHKIPPRPKKDSLYKFGNTTYNKNNASTNTKLPSNELITLDLKKFLNKYIDLHEPLLLKKKPLPIELTEEEQTFEFKILDEKIENLTDLINLGKKYESEYKDKKFRFNLNLRVLSLLVEPIEELNKMIGMKNIKTSIFNKIILHLQGLDNKNTDYNHIVLYGGPGMGKTHVAKILGKIYSKMGFLSKGEFRQIKLTDLKAGFVGQTEIKTQKLLDSSLGSVLFLDEAYSLGGNDKLDSFSQSIIDTINPFLDEHKDDFILIIAGYKLDLEERFFKGNQGLRSRFGLWLEIDDYSVEDLKKIFIKQIDEYGWDCISEDITIEFFKINKKYFKFFGRDIQNLFSKCKIAHAKRVLFCKENEKKTINKEDLDNGFKLYKKNIDMGTSMDMDKDIMFSMYN